MKKYCSSSKKIFKVNNLFLLLAIVFGQSLYAQESQEMIRSVDRIPEVVQQQIVNDLLDWNKTDSLSTQFVDSLSQGKRYIFSYNLRKEGNQLKGVFSKKIECDDCLQENNFWSYHLNLQFVYCCKDPEHDPSEVELTEEEMKKTQKEKGCKKIGVCFMK